MTRQTDPHAAGSRRQVVVFTVDGQRFGLALAATERVLPMVAVSPLPGSPAVVLGAINLHGEVVPVLDVRRRLGLEPAEYGPAARLVIARAGGRTVALPVDDVSGAAELAVDSITSPAAVMPGTAHLSGIAALADGILLIHDLDAFLSIDEERQLDEALRKERG